MTEPATSQRVFHVTRGKNFPGTEKGRWATLSGASALNENRENTVSKRS